MDSTELPRSKYSEPDPEWKEITKHIKLEPMKLEEVPIRRAMMDEMVYVMSKAAGVPSMFPSFAIFYWSRDADCNVSLLLCH